MDYDVSSGITESGIILENNSMTVLDGGVAIDTTVNSGGRLNVSRGGKVTGRMVFEVRAVVSMYEGAVLDFDLTQAEAGGETALVNDLSIIQGTPIYTLTVDADLWKPGTYDYLLAEGASEFNSTISVMNNTTGETLETLKIGEKVMIGYNDYMLNLDEGALSLTVEVPDVTAPVITLTADTETVVLQTTLTATVDDGSTIQYRIGEFGLWKEYKEPIIASLNETYYFMAMDDAGNIGTNQITFGNIDTSGVLLSTLWSQRGINPMGGNTTIMYNEYTPLACFLNSLPDRNLISVMLESDRQEESSGLFLIEPYQPGKIPVLFIHGLMSSPDTWVQMINSLKNDPVIRKRYQFWFYSFSSGMPILATAGNLRRILLAAREELGTTQEARENFDKMVLIGHSMGGLVSRTLLQDDPRYMVETVTQRSWDEITASLSEDELDAVETFAVLPPLPFVNRVVFMAVPHRGSDMAKWSLARFGSRLVSLPKTLREKLPLFARVFEKLNKEKYQELEKLRRERGDVEGDHSVSGLYDLDPDSLFIQALADSPMKKGLVFHSIIGDQERADHPGGTDGVVPYSSSHLDNVESEVIVHSGHSIHRSPAAMRELLRILRLHLRELEGK